MQLADFIADPKRRDLLVEAVGTCPDYLWQIATSWRGRRPSPAMARKIAAATCGMVTLSELRPDIWPESEAA